MPDLDLILDYLPAIDPEKAVPSSSTIRTKRAVGRFETAIKTTYFNPLNTKLSSFLMSTLRSESITDYSKYILFLTASANNELFDYLNRLVFFPALYSGRAIIKSEEVLACLVELKQTESQLQKW